MSEPWLFPLLKFLYFPQFMQCSEKHKPGKVGPKVVLAEPDIQPKGSSSPETDDLRFMENHCPYLLMLGTESVCFTLLHRIFMSVLEMAAPCGRCSVAIRSMYFT